MAGMAAAGAAAGTAIMPGIGTVIGGIAGALLDGEMSKGGDSGSAQGPGGPSNAAHAVYGSGLNADNWNVNFSGRQTNTSSADKRLEATGPTQSASAASGQGAVMPMPQGSSGGGLGNLGGVPMLAWLGIGGLVLWKLSRSAR
jgi:hypothetical protein